jgi:curved DNA-binding protein CbpA
MGVRRAASKKKLKEAYRHLAKRVHPDKTTDDRADRVRGRGEGRGERRRGGCMLGDGYVGKVRRWGPV